MEGWAILQSGMSDRFIELITNMYKELKSCVRLENGYTSYFESRKGTRQGCPLSPTLFNVFVNDLPNVLMTETTDYPLLGKEPIPCLLYADDIVILSKSKSGLQNSLLNLQNYCKSWKLSISIKKTKIMILNKKVEKTDKFYIGNSKLQVETKLPYLGITFNANGTFKSCIKSLTLKAQKSYYLIRQQFNIYTNTQIQTLCYLFDTMVKPVCLYGSEVWGAYNINKLDQQGTLKSIINDNLEYEKLHLKFCKNILGFHKKSTNIASQGELGRYPIQLDIISNVFSYWAKIQHNKVPILTRIALQNEIELHEKGQITFVTFINNGQKHNVTHSGKRMACHPKKLKN